MSWYIGIDTSNYTSSVAAYNGATGEMIQCRRLLPVAKGKLGLKQSDAVFLHVKQLGDLLEEMLGAVSGQLLGVTASASPRDEDGSYMPCFLVGELVGRACAATAKVPFYKTSHQNGHVMAALFSAHKLQLCERPFLAFHFSGGTTQCLLVQPDSEQLLKITTVAQTLDLNAGQAVDRVGAMLGLSFPAGPELEKLANGCEKRFKPKVTFKGLDCCLSGVENQCRQMLDKGNTPAEVAKYCLDYLALVVITMTEKALEMYPGYPLVYAGGVLSNRMIRSRVEECYDAHFAEPAFSSDNAAGTAVICAMKHREQSE